MGNYLDDPEKGKNPEPGEDDQFAWGACGMQGWRKGMEDAHYIGTLDNDENDCHLFAVFDGHGGDEVAKFCKKEIYNLFRMAMAGKADPEEKQYREALTKTFKILDEKVKEEIPNVSSEAGATACVVMVTPDKIYCANAGDSRAVLCRGGETIALSDDHKPGNDKEKERIISSGHTFEEGRVDGTLAVARAIGDHQFKDKPELGYEKQAVTCDPDISVHERDPAKDEFIFVACDGIWDCRTNEEVVKYFREQLSGDNKPESSNICPPIEKLLDECLAPNTDGDGIGTDNMTAILATFKKK